jgi:uncharacterized membrane protein
MSSLMRYVHLVFSRLKTFSAVLLIFGTIGLIASVAISEEKLSLIRHPKDALVCDLNPVYACGKIIDSSQSKLLGFSNEIIGIFMFTVLITTGVVLIAGGKLKPWYWKFFLLGMLGFMLSVGWLFYQSVYVIGNLCILCTTVWFCGWLITVRGFNWMYDQKLIKPNKKLQPVLAYIRRNSVGFWLLLVMIAVGLVLNHFWYYYGKYF